MVLGPFRIAPVGSNHVPVSGCPILCLGIYSNNLGTQKLGFGMSLQASPSCCVPWLKRHNLQSNCARGPYPVPNTLRNKRIMLFWARLRCFGPFVLSTFGVSTRRNRELYLITRSWSSGWKAARNKDVTRQHCKRAK